MQIWPDQALPLRGRGGWSPGGILYKQVALNYHLLLQYTSICVSNKSRSNAAFIIDLAEISPQSPSLRRVSYKKKSRLNTGNEKKKKEFCHKVL